MPNGPQIGNFFEIEFVPLPNFINEEANFIEQVDQLKTRF
jgi:hypothetical protein